MNGLLNTKPISQTLSSNESFSPLSKSNESFSPRTNSANQSLHSHQPINNQPIKDQPTTYIYSEPTKTDSEESSKSASPFPNLIDEIPPKEENWHNFHMTHFTDNELKFNHIFCVELYESLINEPRNETTKSYYYNFMHLNSAIFNGYRGLDDIYGDLLTLLLNCSISHNIHGTREVRKTNIESAIKNYMSEKLSKHKTDTEKIRLLQEINTSKNLLNHANNNVNKAKLDERIAPSEDGSISPSRLATAICLLISLDSEIWNPFFCNYFISNPPSREYFENEKKVCKLRFNSDILVIFEGKEFPIISSLDF